MTWKILYSKTALALYGAVLWGRAIADTSPNPNHSTFIEAFIALFGGMILAWLPRSWVGTLVIPSGYAIGMFFVAVAPWGNLDITFVKSLLFILLSLVGSSIGMLILQVRHQGHQPS